MSLENIIGFSITAIFLAVPIVGIVLANKEYRNSLSKNPEPQPDNLITYTQAQMDAMNACHSLLDKIERNKQRCDRLIKACDDWLLQRKL